MQKDKNCLLVLTEIKWVSECFVYKLRCEHQSVVNKFTKNRDANNLCV